MAHVFQERVPPVAASPAGYAWLVDTYDLQVPTPPIMAGIGESHKRVEAPAWLILSPRHAPENTLSGHLIFALKNEGVNLPVLKALTIAIPDSDLEAVILAQPSGKYARRLWFLVEWLTGRELVIQDASSKRGLEPVLDPNQQYALTVGETSERHRVINNLPGTPDFCPLVRKTEVLRSLETRQLQDRAREVAGQTHPDVMARAAAFLLLSDSKASFQIEQERPSPDRTRRWAQAIARAGSEILTESSLSALQEAVIGDSRFVTLGLRKEGGFIGSRDRMSGAPLPEHVSARPEDLKSLVGGMIAYDARSQRGELEPVVATAGLSFGFVYAHPFEDGNGRLHRWLIHHGLSASGFAPSGFVFPVSQVMLRRIESYRAVLESYSAGLLGLIEWEPTTKGNVKVLNDTADFYRYFDATAHAEFLYTCVAETVDHDLPDEVAYLQAYDLFAARVEAIVDMPERTLDLLRGFLEQNGGVLSARAKTKEFSALTEGEVDRIQEIYSHTIGELRA
jgi:hypothetical protein